MFGRGNQIAHIDAWHQATSKGPVRKIYAHRCHHNPQHKQEVLASALALLSCLCCAQVFDLLNKYNNYSYKGENS